MGTRFALLDVNPGDSKVDYPDDWDVYTRRSFQAPTSSFDWRQGDTYTAWILNHAIPGYYDNPIYYRVAGETYLK